MLGLDVRGELQMPINNYQSIERGIGTRDRSRNHASLSQWVMQASYPGDSRLILVVERSFSPTRLDSSGWGALNLRSRVIYFLAILSANAPSVDRRLYTPPPVMLIIDGTVGLVSIRVLARGSLHVISYPSNMDGLIRRGSEHTSSDLLGAGNRCPRHGSCARAVLANQRARLG